jgi:hypothetical protein
MDRSSKETMKALDILSKITMQEDKIESQENLKAMDSVIKAELDQQKIDSSIESVRIKAMERLAAMQDKDSRERDFKIADVIKDVVSKEPKQKKENDDA